MNKQVHLIYVGKLTGNVYHADASVLGQSPGWEMKSNEDITKYARLTASTMIFDANDTLITTEVADFVGIKVYESEDNEHHQGGIPTHEHPSHPGFWQDADGNSPPLFTVITIDDVHNGKYIPRDTKHYHTVIDYLGALAATSYPTHCLLGGDE
jgi:hypothetical protein